MRAAPSVTSSCGCQARAASLKEITVKGAGGAKPATGQKVTAHYTGKLSSGAKFDSSKDRGRPFQFTIGIGQVIGGWDEGMATMTKGEKAVLTCTYPYAYGEEGIPGTIPPRATLHFEVELIDFK